jgi:hypothetical protein
VQKLIEEDSVPQCFINIIIDDDLYNDEILQNFEFDSKDKIASSKDSFVGVFKVSEYKGMESNIILYLHRENTEYNFKYVGLTRARFYLYDIEIKERNNY